MGDKAIETPFKDIAQAYAGTLKNYMPFPTVSDRNFWNTLPAFISDELKKQGLAAQKQTYPSLSATDYMNFLRNGNRVNFENAYFKRRHLINQLVLAECLENKGNFLDKIIDGIWCICEESTWCLPAHNSYIRNTPQIILPDVEKPVLDLFACETGALLATIVYLLKDSLNSVSTLIVDRIIHELRKRIINPYLSTHFWWMGNGDEPMCNWTP